MQALLGSWRFNHRLQLIFLLLSMKAYLRATFGGLSAESIPILQIKLNLYIEFTIGVNMLMSGSPFAITCSKLTSCRHQFRDPNTAAQTSCFKRSLQNTRASTFREGCALFSNSDALSCADL
jgi:hypothetical protein